MKIKRIYENNNFSNYKKIIEDFDKLKKAITPSVIDRYFEIFNNDDLQQEIVDIYGSDFFHESDKNKLILREIDFYDNKVFCTFISYNGDVCYVPFTYDEFERLLINLDSSKYNL